MEFLANIYNHNEAGQRSIEDIIGIIGHQIRALGHQCMWDVKNDKLLPAHRGYNLIVEGFTPATIRVLAEGYEQGARFVFVCTEEPTPKGFNWGTQDEMIMRQKNFPEAAKFCEGIIHLVPGKAVTRWYSEFAPSAHSELGYAPSLVRTGDFEPTFDFGFFGSLSPRRYTILKKLAKRIGTPKAVRVVSDFPDQTTRDRQIREAKVVVQLRKFDQMGLVSSSRCNTSLCLGRPIIAEPHELSSPWDQIVKFSSTLDKFYDWAIMIRAMWKGIHADQFEKFKGLTPESCIGRAMREIGIDLSNQEPNLTSRVKMPCSS